MPAERIIVKGIREVNRAFMAIDRDLERWLNDELLRTAEPVAADARARISRYQGAVTSTIKPMRKSKGVVVRQGTRKRDGRHGQFGSLQMGHLVRSLYDHEDEIREAVDDTLNRLARREGF